MTARDAGSATVKLFSKGHVVGSRSMTYHSTCSEVMTGVVQILLHALDVLCDMLLVKRQLPTVAQVDAALSDVFENESVTCAVPTLSFEKFLESYRFTAGARSSHCLSVCLSVSSVN